MKKSWIGTTSLALVVGLLAACGNQTPANNATDNSPPAKEPENVVEKQKDPVTLTFYDGAGDWNEERFMRVIGEPLKAKFPYITPKFEAYGNVSKVPSLIASNQAPDVIFNSSGLAFDRVIVHGMNTDITSLVTASKMDLSKFDQTALDLTKQLGDGKLYGIPAFMAPAAVYYNKDLFDKFGIGYPSDQLTWDELYDLSKKLTRSDGDTQYYGLYMSVGHLAFRNQLTLPLVDTKAEKAVVQTDQWKTFMEDIVRFYQVPGYESTETTLGLASMKDRFFKTKTAAMWMPVSGQPSVADFGDMNWDIAPFPSYKDQPGVGPQPYPVIFFPTSASKHKEAAFEAVAYLASEEYQMPFIRKGEFFTALNTPALQTAFAADEPAYKGKNTKAFLPKTYAKASPQSRYDSTARAQMELAFNSVVLGTKDINTALRDAAEAIDKKIAEVKASQK